MYISFKKKNGNFKKPEYIKKEEFSGEKKDIDNFKSFIKQRRLNISVSLNKSIIITQNDPTPSKTISRQTSRSGSGLLRKKDYPDFDEFQEFDLKTDNKILKKKNNLTKGQKLFQKIKFVLKMNKKGEIFQRILQGSVTDRRSEIPDEKSGYSTGSLIKVYPDIGLLSNYGEIEKMSRMRGFSSESILEAERVSLPIAEFFCNILKDSLDFEENKKWSDRLDIERKDQGFLVEMLCDYDCSIIQKMFVVRK